MRTDGALCTNNGSNVAGVGLWLGLENQDQDHLAQMGFDKYRDSAGVVHTCRFYETVPGPPHDYLCGGTDDGDYVYFQVFKYGSPQGPLIAGQDCGVGDNDYSTCVTKFSGVDASNYHLNFAERAAEAQRPGCVDNFMGNSSNPANIGNGGNPVEVLPDADGSWKNNPDLDGFSQDGVPCSHYHGAKPHPQAMTFWDDRNVN